jgi:hypothetical protein
MLLGSLTSQRTKQMATAAVAVYCRRTAFSGAVSLHAAVALRSTQRTLQEGERGSCADHTRTGTLSSAASMTHSLPCADERYYRALCQWSCGLHANRRQRCTAQSCVTSVFRLLLVRAGQRHNGRTGAAILALQHWRVAQCHRVRCTAVLTPPPVIAHGWLLPHRVVGGCGPPLGCTEP